MTQVTVCCCCARLMRASVNPQIRGKENRFMLGIYVTILYSAFNCSKVRNTLLVTCLPYWMYRSLRDNITFAIFDERMNILTCYNY